MTVQDSDKFLVDRGGTNYQITTDNLMAELLDDDLMLVSRDGTNYKATGREIKDSLEPPVVERPPALTSISLVELDPDTNPRFTDSSFLTTLNLSDQGEPVSEKVIDAYVEGAIRQTGKFDEPLESSAGSTPVTDTWSNYVLSSGGLSFPGRAFDGNVSSYAQADGRIDWEIPSFGFVVEQIAWWDGTSNCQVKVTYTDDTFDIVLSTNGSSQWRIVGVQQKPIKMISLESTGVGVAAYWFAIKLNDTLMIDGQPFDPGGSSLNFAAGTDLSMLASGDAVTQGESITPKIYSDYLTIDGNGWSEQYPPTGAFDGTVGTLGGVGTYAFGNTSNRIDFDCSTFPLSGDFIVHSYWSAGVSSITVSAFENNEETTTNQVVIYGLTGVNNGADASFTGLSNVTKISIEAAATGSVLLSAITLNGQVMVDGQGIGTVGIVGSVDNATKTVTLSSGSGTWTDGVNVTGPRKTIVTDNTRKYLQFDSNGNISDLLDAPQDPPYSTVDPNPSLNLTFPSLFPSGQAPDDELGDETTLTVTGTATNTAGSSGPIAAIVQPVGSADGPNLTGLTSLWSGNGSASRDIVNGIDLVNNDGLVWIKDRTYDGSHQLFDTIRGADKPLVSNDNSAQNGPAGNKLLSYNEDGFTIGNHPYVGASGYSYAGWTFQKAAGYFDVQEFTSNAVNETFSHDLGTKPGLIIFKRVNGTMSWFVYHSAMGAGKALLLDSGNAASNAAVFPVEPTDTEWTFGGQHVGANTEQFIAYLFAEDTPNLIKCGTYRGIAGSQTIDVGFDCQWLLIKSISGNGIWTIQDTKRGGGNFLQPHMNSAELAGYAGNVIDFNPGGFILKNDDAGFNGPGVDYMYVAIAAPPIV